MALALLYPEPDKPGRGKKGKGSDFSERFGIGKGHAHNLISDARAVLRYSRELAHAVRDGTMALS